MAIACPDSAPDVARSQSFCAEGFYYYDRADWGAAVACLQEAIRLDANNALALRLAARVRAIAPPPWADPELALVTARRATAANPSFTSPRTTAGIALLRLGRLAEAVADDESSQQGFNWCYSAIAAARAADRASAEHFWQLAEAWWARPDSARPVLPHCLREELAAARSEARDAVDRLRQ